MAAGWIAALLAPVLINLTAEYHGLRPFLVQEAVFHLPTAALVTWFTGRWVEGTAYAYLRAWCWWALAATVMVALAGLLVVAWNGRHTTVRQPD